MKEMKIAEVCRRIDYSRLFVVFCLRFRCSSIGMACLFVLLAGEHPPDWQLWKEIDYVITEIGQLNWVETILTNLNCKSFIHLFNKPKCLKSEPR